MSDLGILLGDVKAAVAKVEGFLTGAGTEVEAVAKTAETDGLAALKAGFSDFVASVKADLPAIENQLFAVIESVLAGGATTGSVVIGDLTVDGAALIAALKKAAGVADATVQAQVATAASAPASAS